MNLFKLLDVAAKLRTKRDYFLKYYRVQQVSRKKAIYNHVYYNSAPEINFKY